MKFIIPGLEPDTAETLIADSLITEEQHPDGPTTHTFLEPYNLRVIAWAMGVNEFAKKLGHGEVFPDLPADVVQVAPGTNTLMGTSNNCRSWQSETSLG